MPPDQTDEKPEPAAGRRDAPSFETLLDSVGGFGRYQRLLCLGLVGSSTFVCALTYYAQVLVLLAPPLVCRDGGGAAGTAVSQADACRARDARLGDDRSVTVCGNWTHDADRYFVTVTSENGWVCGDAWKPLMVHAVFWVGNIVGSWFWGTVSDKLGRRPAILASFVVYAVGGVLTLVRPSNIAVLASVRFLVGTAHHTISHLPYMLVIEYCGSSARVYPLLALIGSWGLGGALLPGIAYLVWDWRILVVLSSQPLLLTLAFYSYIPESSAWLMVRGRGQDAAALLRKMAAVNGRQLDEAAFTEVLVDITSRDPDKEKQSILLVRRHPRLMRNMVVVILLWMVSCLCFYGHTQNTANLGGSVLSSFSLGSSIELLAMAVPFIINSLGRKWPMVLFFVSSGVCGLLYALVGHAVSAGVRLAFGLCGRMLIMGAYSSCLQYGPELFPTVVRGQSLALYELLGGVAIFISPSIVYLHEQTPGLPLLIIGTLSLLGGALTTLLPETVGRNLPQTMLDGDELGRHQSLLPCRNRQVRPADNGRQPTAAGQQPPDNGRVEKSEEVELKV